MEDSLENKVFFCNSMHMKYYYDGRDNNPVGPIEVHELQELYRKGSIGLDTWVIEEGGSEWKTYAAVFEGFTSRPPLPSEVYQQVQSRTEPLAIWSLVLGILSLLSCVFVVGVPAVICGHLARAKTKKNPALQGAGMAVAGIVTGYLSIFIMFLAIFAIAIPNILSITSSAQESMARRNAHEIASVASMIREAGAPPFTDLEAGVALITGDGITVRGRSYDVTGLSDEEVLAALPYLRLSEGRILYNAEKRDPGISPD
jgi:hypothetical protein